MNIPFFWSAFHFFILLFKRRVNIAIFVFILLLWRKEVATVTLFLHLWLYLNVIFFTCIHIIFTITWIQTCFLTFMVFRWQNRFTSSVWDRIKLHLPKQQEWKCSKQKELNLAKLVLMRLDCIMYGKTTWSSKSLLATLVFYTDRVETQVMRGMIRWNMKVKLFRFNRVFTRREKTYHIRLPYFLIDFGVMSSFLKKEQNHQKIRF